MKKNRDVIPLRELAERLAAGKLNSSAVSITFDDGYACNDEVAAPLLEEAGLPATIFIPTHLIEAGQEAWWDRLAAILIDHPAQSIVLELEEDRSVVDLGEKSDGDWHWQPGQGPSTPRQEAFHATWAKLQVLPPDAQRSAVDRLASQSDERGPRASHRLMTAERVRGVQSDLIELGGHSLTHTALSHRSRDEQEIEIRESRRELQAMSGTVPKTFAYPYGDYDANSVELAREAGFMCACTTDHGGIRKNADAFALPRIAVGNWDGRQLGARLSSV
ncbi:polysaccharide deacetylase family protein [Novosphingobium mangrovi (ex Huang et al. 2023)]|uniref:Chitooligosaccharide deacetylase n=1 Tax=Novosphingobium mangrovi (ex Huang et al. 2023) TaxID=2976432 RepID=A0ABT2I9K0_9SPHN|nr:polysaccharide deacetylase family protein [Novosphingobium mangrovi (ex Huang et al. 2023)]MCT2401499.1 polysaccharide deacetylase family protein [Novosphingobium mangrovi (ex Huang et al. 2023)]